MTWQPYEIVEHIYDVDARADPGIASRSLQHGGRADHLHGEVTTLRDGDPEAVVGGLTVIGEGACVSVHGANRLGSNSLLDIIVFGRAAARRMAKTVRQGERHAPVPEEASDRAIARLDRIRWSKGGLRTGLIRLAMQRTMQNHCGVFRDGPLLEKGLSLLVAGATPAPPSR